MTSKEQEAFQKEVIRNFLSSDGRLKQLPKQKKKRFVLLKFLVENLDFDVIYSESDINSHISRYHNDYCTIRRELIMNGLMSRTNGQYRLNSTACLGNSLDTME